MRRPRLSDAHIVPQWPPPSVPGPFYAFHGCSLGCGRTAGREGVFVRPGIVFCRACALSVRTLLDAWLEAER